MKRVTYVCATCGGNNVKWDAWAEWDEENGAELTALNNSFGFGGANASLIFRRVPQY